MMGDETVPANTIVGDTGLFQCGSCKRQYKRLDHLARHVRSHTQTKPYSCKICSKAFARTDILKRHIAGHEAQGVTPSVKSSYSDAKENPGRVTQACRACSSNHLRCSEEKPCRRCTSKGIDCVWTQPSDSVITPPSSVSQASEATFDMGNTAQPAHLADMEPLQPQLMESRDMAPGSPSMSGMDGGMNNALPGFFPDWNLLPGQWTPLAGQDFGLTPNIDLDDVDLRFLDSYNLKVPFEFGTASHAGSATDPAFPLENTTPTSSSAVAEHTYSSSSSSSFHPAALGSEAFRRSHWRFRPNRHDHGGAEEHNLSLDPQESADHAVSSRDKILTMVVESCRPQNLSRAVAAGMAADGAVMTADPALTKLGYAIQECVRVSVPKDWERNNSLIRDLELLQAFFFTLEIGLWSGHGRKVEIAESFLQPLLTMTRRGNKFRRSAYPPIVVRADDDHETLTRTWHAWVKQESFKRVALRMKQHDSDMSLALLVNPIVSYAETQLPLPSSERLWAAPTAEKWRAEYLALEQHALERRRASGGAGLVETTPGYLPSVTDLLDNPDGLHVYGADIDVTFASFSFLANVWNLAWEYTQLESLQRAPKHRWNTLVMTSRLEELVRLLNHFRLCMDATSPYAYELNMRLEVVFLHLHVPFDDIQLFAGMDGPEHARVVYPGLVEWARGEPARRAVWHAGQVLRWARLLPRTALQRATAIMVYHAALTLWVYGLLSYGGVAGPMEPPSAQAVRIDLEDGVSVQRFTQFGRGYPCVYAPHLGQHQDQQQQQQHLQHHSNHQSYMNSDVVYLFHPDGVIEVTMAILRANHEGLPQPRLVHQLIELMSELQRASRKGMEV
ncbi:unnamed protein product [Parascedosporium putredinis]|uniref:Uncharacterized protein n=1 Tax=Parascedosporium putredinis TaxID=1442378 RepID=A0A9P1H1Y0_9PEZI|nr:unnamed protein product [Parascedosporium putredinis]CAI7993474.1 unnamed protein product [Parascedosporium putredinis]